LKAARRLASGIDMSGRQKMTQQYKLAIDYLENRQLDDTRNELNNRFPMSMQIDQGQAIQPVVMPLAERYIAEAASIYNKPLTRTLVGEDGKENAETKAQTKKYQDFLGAVYDEKMHRNEHLTVLLRSSVVVYEAKRGKLRAAIRYPHDVYPLAPENPGFVEASDPEDYEGFLIEIFGATSGVTGQKSMRTFALYTHGEVQFWLGESPDKLKDRLSVFDNPYEWEQAIEDVDYASGDRAVTKKVVPGRMVTFWHMRYPLEGVIAKTDPDIVAGNRELNIAWSSLLDTIKLQGHAVPVITSTSDKGDGKAKRRYGARWPLNLRAGETFQLASASQNYTDQVGVLQSFVKMMAALKRQSPSDFSMDQAAAMSGFAKVVDSLPKIEARAERWRRVKYMEEEEAWPRHRAIGLHLGALDASVNKMKLRAQCAGVEFPQSEDERAKKLDTDTKYNLTSIIHELAEREGITEEEAKERFKQNAADNESVRPAPMSGMPGAGPVPGGGQPGRFGQIVGRTTRGQGEEGKGVKAEKEAARD
jgi:hypothetical protein